MTLFDTFFNARVMSDALPALLRGLRNTLGLAALSIVCGASIGLVAALVRLYAVKPLRWLAVVYIDVFRAMREQDRFVRGMFAWVGFRQTAVEFHREERVAGETKWPIGKLVRLAISGVVGFSDAPLRFALWMGAGVSAVAMLYGSYVMVSRFFTANYVPGWASTIVVVAFLGGFNMLLTGVLGIYVGRIHNEVKRRPLYIVGKREGFETNAAAEAPARRSSAA